MAAFFSSDKKYSEGCSKINYLLTCKNIITGFALKKWLISLAGGSSEPFQDSWAYLEGSEITPMAVAQFLRAWEARKKEGFF